MQKVKVGHVLSRQPENKIFLESESQGPYFHTVFKEFYIKYTSSQPDIYRSTVHKEKSRNIFPKNWIPLELHDLLVLF